MNIQISTDNHIEGGQKFSDYVSGVVTSAFTRFSDLTLQRSKQFS